MSHHIYQTKAVVLGGRDFGESNRLLYLITERFGFLAARAQGIRMEKSKLRGSLQDFSGAEVELVRGRDLWRVTNASSKWSYRRVCASGGRASAAARIAKFLRRFLHGEEHDPRLFALTRDFFELLGGEALSAEELLSLEILTNVHVLHALGYVNDEGACRALLEAPLAKPSLALVPALKKEALEEINRALRESQL